ERARQRQSIEVELTRDRGPERPLVASPDVALEVDAPRLVAAGREADRAERDRELRRPPDVGNGRAHFPRAVPVEVETGTRAGLLRLAAAEAAAALPFIGHLAVVLETRRIGAEHEAVQPIPIRVKDH